MLITLDFTTLVAGTIERLIGSDGSPYEKRVGAKGRVLSNKCIVNEVPFDKLPEGWALTRFQTVCLGSFTGPFGSTLHRSDYVDNGIPVINPANIYDGLILPTKMVSEDTRKRLSSYVLHSGDFIIGRRGEMGRAAIISAAEEGWLCGTGCFFAHTTSAIEKPFWKLYFDSAAVINQLEANAVGTTMKNLNLTILDSLLFPLPPLAEQRRIVERVDELMPLVEEYGELEDARGALDAALPGRLRKSVLQLAVQGGLVPQDPADEPAGVLLERIRGQRRQLVAEGKMRAPKGGESIIFAGSDGRRYEKRVDAKGRESDPVCIDDEIPFEIPEGWEWARLGSVFAKMGSGSTPAGGRKVYQDEGPMLIRSQNVHNEGLRLDDVAHFAYSLFAKRGSHVLPNDMLLNITGASIGRCAIVPDTFGDADVNQHVLIMRPVLPIASEYLHAAIISPLVQSAIMVGQVGATKEGLSASKAAELLVPFPPLVEQRRIVDVVDRLFKLLA